MQDTQPTADTSVTVIDADGVRGYADRHTLQKVRGGDNAQIAVQFGERVALVDVDALVPEGDDVYRLPLRLQEVEVDVSTADQRTPGQAGERAVIPVIEEQIHVEKRQIETGRVRVVKRVNEREEEIDIPLVHEEVQVERVSINKFVDEAPSIRREGATLIMPVMEEVLVVEKRLRIREEVRITGQEFQTTKTARATLREEEVSVEREAAESAASTSAPPAKDKPLGENSTERT